MQKINVHTVVMDTLEIVILWLWFANQNDLFWKSRHTCGYAYIVTKAIHADKLVMSGQTNWTWSLAINSVNSQPEKIWFEKKSNLPEVWI